MQLLEIISKFRNAMAEAGINYSGEILTDTPKIQRFHIDGDKSKSTNGWYILHTDGVPAGEFGSWKTGLQSTWCEKSTSEITPEERRSIAERAERVKKEREAEEYQRHAEAAETALMIWEAAEEATAHPYLTSKNVSSYGLRIGKWPVSDSVIENALLIPIKDGKKITSLQAIFPDSNNIYGRDKTFLTGGKKKGGYFTIGKPDKSQQDFTIAICEGYATGATIYAATGWPVVVAFNDSNLKEVAEKARKLFLNARIVICADNDQWTQQPIENPGVHYAKLAASDCNAFVAIPEFNETSSKPTDFNDLQELEGLTSVHLQLMSVFKPKEIEVITESGDVAIQYLPDTTAPLPDVNGNGKPVSTIENLQAICSRLNVQIRYNVITKEEEILIPNESFSVDNQANASLAFLMSWSGRFRFPVGQLGDFVTYLADKNLFNPVAEWVTSKPWDGVSRLQDICNTLIVENEDDELHKDLKEVLIKRWLISAIAAAFEPHGVSAHGVLVIQGRQSLGKTAWFKRLVPKHLGVIADGLMLKPDDKDSVKQAVSNWLVELGELDATFRKADIAQLKSFLTRDRDTLRRAYARRESTFARRTVFFASVNPKEFLHDSTGNRRYWTLSCVDINHKHDIDMQQMWAEIYELYKSGEPWVLWPHELDALNEINKEYETIDPITERLQSKLDWDAPKLNWVWRSATEILILVGLDKPSHGDSTKCSQSMKELNGNQAKKTKSGRLLHCPPRLAF